MANSLGGSYILSISTLGGTTAQINQNARSIYYCTGSQIVKADTSTGLPIPVGVAQGGTGAITAPDALTNLGGTTVGKAVFVAASESAGRAALLAAASGVNGDITQLTGLTTPLTVEQGGTELNSLTANAVIIGNGTAAPTFVAPGANGNVLTSNGTLWQSSAPAAGGLNAAATKTANYTAVAGDVLACNTITTGAFSITLPASPVAGQRPIIIFDSGTTDVVNGFATNNLTVLRNGSTINTLADDVVFSTKGVSVIFEYIAGTWRMRIG